MIFHEARELWRSLKTVHSVILWGSHWMHTTYCEEEGEKSGNIPNCRRNLFFPSWESRAHRKVFERFYDFCTLHIAHRADQPSPQAKPSHAHNEQTTDPCGIPEVRPRLQTSGPTTPKCLMCHPPPLISLTTPMSPQRISRVNKNTRRLLAVTGPCSWMRHNFSQFPR